MGTLTEQLRHKPFPEIAQALRDRSDAILKHWRTLVVEALPHIDDQAVAEFEDDIAAILALVADSLESDDARAVTALLDKAPIHGLDRFLQQYDLADVLVEHRILRSVVIAELEETLSRRLEAPEAASIHAIIDVMFHQGTLMMVKKQHEELRAAAEAEHKFLAYLTHDLNNNLMAVSFLLQTTAKQIAQHPDLTKTAERLSAAHETIHNTRDGMKQLLRHERMRHSHTEARCENVSLRPFIEAITATLKSQADDEDIDLHINIPDDCRIETDPNLLTLILQNIIHNAVQHSRSAVHITASLETYAEQSDNSQRCRISIADNGPGIDDETLSHILDAFEQGDAPLGTPGVGLGLAIAAQAANALDAHLTIEPPEDASPEDASHPETGTTFHILLPAAPASAS